MRRLERSHMDLKLNPGRLYGAAIVALSIWFLHGFLQGLLAASVAAIASWSLYHRFAARVGKHVGRPMTAFVFTALITVFVLAPMAFALEQENRIVLHALDEQLQRVVDAEDFSRFPVVVCHPGPTRKPSNIAVNA